MAVEIFYQNLNSLPHPEQGMLRLMYFGHTSDGQKKITRYTAEALVMLLEANGFHLCNGVSEAAAWLMSEGYRVEAPGEDPQEDPVEDPKGIDLGFGAEARDVLVPLFSDDDESFGEM